MNIPRSEHPFPQLSGRAWQNLNGEWEFFLDREANSTDEEDLKKAELPQKITVPFCPESILSGIGDTAMMKRVFYRRKFSLGEEFNGARVLLHIGACDYHTVIYVNGKNVGSHDGGYTPVTADITDALIAGENVLAVSAFDDLLSGKQPVGKQSDKPESYGCWYTRTTGIWQTVWLEAVGYECHIENYTVDCDIDLPAVTLGVRIAGAAVGKKLTAVASFDGKTVGAAQVTVSERTQNITLPLSEKHLWDEGTGNLYSLSLRVEDAKGVYDEAEGYFGLRTVRLEQDGFYLNGRRVFLRTVLDQGFYPDGICTAPSDEALLRDIEISMRYGFNGARLHQKVFEPRYLYHADRAGYLVFGEFANWGLDHTYKENVYSFLPEWLEAVDRDAMHPSIIGWCPFNETFDKNGRPQSNELINLVYHVTEAADKTRVVFANSGSLPTDNTVNDSHDYEQDPEKFREDYSQIDQGILHDSLFRYFGDRQYFVPGRPLFISEFGGIGWTGDESGWGYGNAVKSEEEFFTRLEGLVDAILEIPAAIGYCYTQLTDVEQEQNGVVRYDRSEKFDSAKFARIFGKTR